MMAEKKNQADSGEDWEGKEDGIDPATQGAFRHHRVRATLHPDAPAALELSIARTRVLDYL